MKFSVFERYYCAHCHYHVYPAPLLSWVPPLVCLAIQFVPTWFGYQLSLTLGYVSLVVAFILWAGGARLDALIYPLYARDDSDECY
ncbi:MAG: hypothetical protein Q4C68_01680 [Moraxella sp.]|nr:hypothetical protein [Moraxella sp.]